MADMDVTIVTNIEGLDEFEAACIEGSPRAVAKFLRTVHKTAAKVLKTSAELNAPIETGNLDRHIGVSTTTNTEGMLTRVGPDRSAFYGTFPEWGAPEHNVPATHWLENSAKAVQGEVLERYHEALALGLEELKR